MTTRDALRAALDAEVPAFLDMIMGSAVLDKLTDAILGDLEAASGTPVSSGWWVPATQGADDGRGRMGRRLYVYTTDQPHPMIRWRHGECRDCPADDLGGHCRECIDDPDWPCQAETMRLRAEKAEADLFTAMKPGSAGERMRQAEDEVARLREGLPTDLRAFSEAHQPWVLPAATECRTCGISGTNAHYMINGTWPCDVAVLLTALAETPGEPR